jgi:hypothetical protein
MIRDEVALVNVGLGGQAQTCPVTYLGPDNTHKQANMQYTCKNFMIVKNLLPQ